MFFAKTASRTTAISVGLACAMTAAPSFGSSHREAPAISKDQFADNTDTYAFISPSNPNNIVLMANWIPAEGPGSGPNYFEWDDAAEYYIYVDNNGDAEADITYKLTSNTTVRDDTTFLYSTGPINNIADTTWNRPQTITVEEITNNSSTVLVNNQLTAPANLGSKSIPDYAKLVDQATYTVGTGDDQVTVFAGQTDDPFFVDLQLFDLLTLRGQGAPIGYSSGDNTPTDSLAGSNVHTLVLEIPITRLTQGTEPVLGVWAAANRNGAQVSRLGMPLVNEVVVPYALKDAFNTLKPVQDLDIYFATNLQRYVEDPLVGNLLCGLYGVPLPADGGSQDCKTNFTAGTARSGRGDIFDIFLTGMTLANDFTINTAGGPATLPAGFNVNQPAGVRPADMIRINTTIKGDTCAPTPHPLGVLGGDACGFPNGRRLEDDVTDIAILAVAGAAYEVLDDRDTTFSFNADLISVLTDGVNANDLANTNTFPYVALAASGQNRVYQNPVNTVDGSNNNNNDNDNTNTGGGSSGSGNVGPLGLLLLALGSVAVWLRGRKKTTA